MGSSNRSESPDFTFCDDAGRPLVTPYNISCKYRPGQQIYLRIPGAAQPDGPYKIETIAGDARYTLCYPDGRTARDGATIEEKDLTESST